jgi:hypothetical protein
MVRLRTVGRRIPATGPTGRALSEKENSMALLEDLFKGGNIVTGLAIGIGAAVLAPAVAPALRPLAKSVIKAGLVAYDQGRAMLAELNEMTGDIVAEARNEIAHPEAAGGGGPGTRT